MLRSVIVMDYQSQWSLTFEVRKRVAKIETVSWYNRSQWSLTFEVRKRRPRHHRRLHPHPHVAMEPDL